jgi:lipid-A-disaccharide synthase
VTAPPQRQEGAGRRLRIFIVAAEESGDRLGAALMRALGKRTNIAPEFSGVGGAAMGAAGLASLFPIDDLSIVGLTAIPRRVPTILRRIRAAAAAVIAARPDILVIIDSPDFTHRVARRVRAAAPDIPIVDYVSPSVWAWRPGRARAMRAYVDHLLALLPFEPAEHARLGGPPCTYVGHPLIEEIESLRPNSAEQARRLADPPIVLVLPGSRSGEIRRLLSPFGAAMALVARHAGPIDLVLPTLPHLADRLASATADWTVRPRIVADPAEKRSAFRAARAALAASGTVTLELALAGVPTVAAYRLSLFEYGVARCLIRVPSVILANLVLGQSAVPEFLQHECKPDGLARALEAVLSDTPERRRQLEAFTRLDLLMGVGTRSPSERAADVVLSVAGRNSDVGCRKPND